MTPWWGSLVFVLVGAMLSIGGAYLLQRQRRKQERRDRLADDQRQALAAALAWIAPLDQALGMGQIQIRKLLNRSDSLQDFGSGFNSAVASLQTLRSSANHQLVLAAGPFPVLEQLRQEIHELRITAVELWREGEGHKPNRDKIIERSLETATTKVGMLQSRLDRLHRELAEAYRKTYD